MGEGKTVRGVSHGFNIAAFDSTGDVELIRPGISYDVEPNELMKLELPGLLETSSTYVGTPKEHYLNAVKEALKKIGSGELEKAVLSRRKSVPVYASSLLLMLRELAEQYADACIYLFSSLNHGLWVGASPELLLKKKGREYTSMSLAGTRQQGQKQFFSDKEAREQQLVTGYIRDIFSRELSDLKVESAREQKAGALIHLLSQLKGNAPDPSAEILNRLLFMLHPTPAVCGLPKAKARQFVEEAEDYNRTLYSGFIGYMDEQGDAEFYVNLRCMNVNGGTATLYAGAGIVEGSQPETEWQETENKMETLLSVIRKIKD